MDNSDPVSLGAYWLHASLIPPAQPMAGAAAVSDVGMKGAERGEVGREGEVKAEKKKWQHVTWVGEGNEE